MHGVNNIKKYFFKLHATECDILAYAGHFQLGVIFYVVSVGAKCKTNLKDSVLPGCYSV
jgi:hypothetical protein